jgi:hypothetical protein
LLHVADIGATPAVDRVVRDDPVCNKVVCTFDVEVVHWMVEHDFLDGRDDVVAARFIEHHHTRHDGRCR